MARKTKTPPPPPPPPSQPLHTPMDVDCPNCPSLWGHPCQFTQGQHKGREMPRAHAARRMAAITLAHANPDYITSVLTGKRIPFLDLTAFDPTDLRAWDAQHGQLSADLVDKVRRQMHELEKAVKARMSLLQFKHPGTDPGSDPRIQDMLAQRDELHSRLNRS